jgi:hypothetical protein
MNTHNFVAKQQDHVESLLTLHKQAKFWATWTHKFDPWGFFFCEQWGSSQL